MNIEQETERLRHLERSKFPLKDIEEEERYLFIKQFGFTKDELVDPIPPTSIEKLKLFNFEDAFYFARRHGFDISAAPSDYSIRLPTDDDEQYDNDEEYEDDDDPLEEGEQEDPLDEDCFDQPIEMSPAYGWVVSDYMAWIEMIAARALGLLPTTDEQINAVRLAREAQKFGRRLEQKRHRPRDDDRDVERVFGRSNSIRPGTITLDGRKGRPGVRQVQVEVVRRRPSSR